MTPLKIGIVEDELLVARSISALLKQIGYSPLKPVRNYNDAIKMLRSESPDFLLIGKILESEPDGIELAATVNKEFGIPFIFLTANSDTATVNRAKLVKPYAYLVKPFYEKELFSSIEIAFENYNQLKKSTDTVNDSSSKITNSLFIKEGNVFHKVDMADILYIESDHVYLNVYTSQKHYIIRTKLEDFIAEYASQNFVRVHRSYAINMNHLQSIHDLSVRVGEKEIPVYKNYKQQLLAMINSLK